MNRKHISLKTQCGQTPHLLHQDLRSMGIGMHPRPSHHALPQTPHLVPPLLSNPPALNYAHPSSSIIMTTFDSCQIPLPLNPGLLTPRYALPIF